MKKYSYSFKHSGNNDNIIIW